MGRSAHQHRGRRRRQSVANGAQSMSVIEHERERHVTRNLQRCERAWKAGVTDAVADAMSLCNSFGVAPPKWLCHAVRQVLQRDELYKSRRRRDMIDFARYDAVCELRERKGEPGIPKT